MINCKTYKEFEEYYKACAAAAIEFDQCEISFIDLSADFSEIFFYAEDAGETTYYRYEGVEIPKDIIEKMKELRANNS